jgi:CARDB
MTNASFLGLTMALSLGLSGAAMAGPDLKPKFSSKVGSVRVTNVGDADAAASWVTVVCAPSGGGSCPDPAPADVAPYLNAAFPNAVAIEMPALAAGEKSTHVIAFFDNLVFAPGSYSFTVCADAGADVAEDSERNNCIVVKKTVRGLVAP